MIVPPSVCGLPGSKADRDNEILKIEEALEDIGLDHVKHFPRKADNKIRLLVVGVGWSFTEIMVKYAREIALLGSHVVHIDRLLTVIDKNGDITVDGDDEDGEPTDEDARNTIFRLCFGVRSLKRIENLFFSRTPENYKNEETNSIWSKLRGTMARNRAPETDDDDESIFIDAPTDEMLLEALRYECHFTNKTLNKEANTTDLLLHLAATMKTKK